MSRSAGTEKDIYCGATKLSMMPTLVNQFLIFSNSVKAEFWATRVEVSQKTVARELPPQQIRTSYVSLAGIERILR